MTSHELARKLLSMPEAEAIASKASANGRGATIAGVTLKETDYQLGRAIDEKSAKGWVVDIVTF